MPSYNGEVYSGLIMNIRDVNSKGFIKGDLEYAEKESYIINGCSQLSPC